MWCALAGCTDTRLAATAPKGVDLSGHWTLNVADSDDATRLMQSQIAAANAGSANQGRRGSRETLPTGPTGPLMPPVPVLDESLRWPGRDLVLTQSPDSITFRSDGIVRTCRPSALKAGGGGGSRAERNDTSAGRDLPARGRGDAPPPRCGWDGRSLVVRSGETEEDSPPYEQRFGLSDDGQRLVEVVVFQGGRSNGFVASREWDRAAKQ